MASHSFFLCTLLTFLYLYGITAVDYQVTTDVPNTPGGIRFTNEIGIPYTKQIMGTSNNFIWSVIFQQKNPSDQKPIDSVHAYIEEFKDPIGITWGNNNINFSSLYIAGFNGDVKREFTSVMYHEMTHVLQWDGEGTAPSGLVEGVAEYTKLKANLPQPGFAKPGDGDRWDEGYDVTARFLEYCDGITPGFVAELNNKMRVTYNVKYFEELTGKPVHQLWQECNLDLVGVIRPRSCQSFGFITFKVEQSLRDTIEGMNGQSLDGRIMAQSGGCGDCGVMQEAVDMEEAMNVETVVMMVDRSYYSRGCDWRS
ncbi:hypothetical protein L6452_28108 [Arctium lappa]|uniref:Uncharacterized protein n=1 Tax=Arctium lappa TaxID=4217 RepID=A0ACB8ZXT2_ARCLA|nr:hypothetical protein L6452_28108 [Arctium lappa]